MMSSESWPVPVPDRAIWDVWLSHYQYPTLACADQVGLFSALEDGPLSLADLSARVSLQPRPAEILVGMMAGLGFLRVDGSLYSLTAIARTYLCPRSPFYWGPAFKSRTSPLQDQILHALRRDEAPGIEWGTSLSELWSEDRMTAETCRAFTSAMHAQSAGPATRLAALPLVKDVRRLLDVAGGSGIFSLRLAECHAGLQTTILELPVTARLTREYVRASPAADRVEIVELDAFTQVWPAGYDAVLLSNVFHDWGATKCAQLTRSAFESLSPGGRILVHEMVLAPDRSSPLSIVCFSMAMLVQTEGKQYCLSELEEILAGAGFCNIEAQPSFGYFSVVAARKPR